jgi:hypothetical protein
MSNRNTFNGAKKLQIMKRRKFVTLTGSTVAIAAATGYVFSDKRNFVRAESKPARNSAVQMLPAENEILYLASLAPSGHNTQPWLLHYIAPYHWVIGNDKGRWLPGVDPGQRETILSIGAFLQNLEYAANSLGYQCQVSILATSNQSEKIAELRLSKSNAVTGYNTELINHRRTIRSNYSGEVFTKEDSLYLLAEENAFIHYIPNTAKEHVWLNEQTVEANRVQAYRDNAQTELANWIRFSSKEAAQHADGLTLASMEIEGIPGWYLRNFYGKKDVLKKSFREKTIDRVAKQVAQSAGWLLITSKDDSVAALLDTGKRLQKLWLKTTTRRIAIHPMTQILEEFATNPIVNQSTGITEPIQFIVRTGYVQNIPAPVSLRRTVNQFVRI